MENRFIICCFGKEIYADKLVQQNSKDIAVRLDRNSYTSTSKNFKIETITSMFEKKHFTVQAGTALVKKHQTVPYLHF
jgi:hypothetical protein